MRHSFMRLLHIALGLIHLFSIEETTGQHVSFHRGAVSAAHPLAVEAGLEILKSGGNAIDAAVAVHFALASVYQIAGNVAGGGFAVVHVPDGRILTLDFRETAPAAAYDSMYAHLMARYPDTKPSLEGATSVGIPGSVAGLFALHDSLGSLPWHRCLQPAIQLADSHRLTPYMASQWLRHTSDIKRISGFLPSFLLHDDSLYPGQLVRQSELANLLRRIAAFGPDSFYHGTFALQMADFLQTHGGVHTAEDFASYQPVWRKPELIPYRGYLIATMPLPSAGGIGLRHFCGMSESLNLHRIKPYSPRYAHYFAEMAKRVYAHRHKYLGDPRDTDPDILSRITSDTYIRQMASSISPTFRTPSAAFGTPSPASIESFETTHYCTADSTGLLVSITTTLNGYFGSKLYFHGMFFNNEMDDFSTLPGQSNQFGLPFSTANKVRPNRRMLSSMTPAILLHRGQPIAAVGTPGGTTIITNIFQVLELMSRGWPLEKAIDQKKLHAQWLPDELIVENGALNPTTIKKLQKMGYQIREIEQIGIFNAIYITPNRNFVPLADSKRKGDSCASGW
ncbi:gamma-glutamyltranspeptidase [Schleiferia thermophila str. Yellowstone]|jgi:gamma-glutamyltranspeptidase/glutathione hydrolase|nr:gamma-glutamyltranspeptidase [Schleiferia thermophila str. Yellowstone]